MPRHVAIIMDGNGRWAQQRGMERCEGHVEGVVTVRRITEEASRLGLQYLTSTLSPPRTGTARRKKSTRS